MLQIENWIDISVPMNKNTVCWPGTSFSVTNISNKENGDFATANEVKLNLHFGTHIDAPTHHIPNGKSVHEIALNKMNGKCRVLEIKNKTVVSAQDLQDYKVEEGEIILLKTANSAFIGQQPFNPNYCALSKDAATYLAEKKISLIGIDYLSIQKFEDSPETHEILLNKNIVILESINLTNVQAGTYEILCLPIKLTGVEAAPCRVLLRSLA